MSRLMLCLIALVAAACGKPPSGNNDSGTPYGCTISTGMIALHTSSAPVTSNSLQCTGAGLSCDGDATLSRSECDDGFAFALTSQSTTLYIRQQLVDGNWAFGAQFPSGSPLNGDISLNGVPSPEMLPPPSGQTEVASFYFQGSGTEANVSANGTLTTTW